MYNGSAQSVGKHGVRLSASRRLYFDIVFKNLVNKAVGP